MEMTYSEAIEELEYLMWRRDFLESMDDDELTDDEDREVSALYKRKIPYMEALIDELRYNYKL